tara:strand:- start:57 stop:233 length:177 start_codon:yes stop_codon:yes gene_type:complete
MIRRVCRPPAFFFDTQVEEQAENNKVTSSGLLGAGESVQIQKNRVPALWSAPGYASDD